MFRSPGHKPEDFCVESRDKHVGPSSVRSLQSLQSRIGRWDSFSASVFLSQVGSAVRMTMLDIENL